MTEKSIIPNDLNKSIQLLLNTSIDVHDSTYGQSKQMFWFTCVNKFFSAYTKIDNPKYFIPIFLKFFEEHKSSIIKPIFSDDDEKGSHVNDSWLKNIDKNTTTKPKDSWSPKDVTCKGVIIYFKPEEEKFKSVSIPITEIYTCAIKIWKEKNSTDSNIRTYPGKILLALYSIFKYSLEESDPSYKDIDKNFKMLSEFIEEISDNKSGKTNDTMSAISKAMASVIKETGVGGDIDPNELQAVLSTALSGDAAKNVTAMLSNVMKTIDTADSSNISDVFSKVGQAMQTKEMGEMAAKTVNDAQTLVDSIPGVKKIFEEPPKVETPDKGNEEIAKNQE